MSIMDNITLAATLITLAFIIGLFIGKYAFPCKPCIKCKELSAEQKRLVQEANELSKGY